MAFHDVRLPDQIERGSQGGPRFRTSILTLSSGFEKRNIDWELSRAAFSCGYGIQTKADFSEVIEFFYARQGRAHSFRFKDWSDFEIGPLQFLLTSDGTSTTVQLFKRYSSGGIDFDRTITKPVNGTFAAEFNAVTRTVVYNTSPIAGQVAVNTSTGLVTLNSTDAATTGQDLTITGEFDIPVRFDTDQIEVNMQTFDAGAIPEIGIIEVRGE